MQILSIYIQNFRKLLNCRIDFSNKTTLFVGAKGKVSHDAAMEKAEKEYEVFRTKQDREYISEFDKEVGKYFRRE